MGRLPHVTRIFALSVVLALAATPSARAEQRVAVVLAARVNIARSGAFDLTDRIAAALKKRLVVDVVSGRKGAALVGTEGGEVAPTCLADAVCLTDLASRLAVGELLLVSITKIGTTLRIDVARFRTGDERARPLRPIQIDSNAGDRAFFDAAPVLVPSAALRAATRTSSARSYASWGLAGASALSLALAGGFGIATWLEHRDLDERCSDFVCPESNFKSLERRRFTADVFLGLGIATGTAAAVLWLTGGGDDEGTALSSGPGDVGLSVISRF